MYYIVMGLVMTINFSMISVPRNGNEKSLYYLVVLLHIMLWYDSRLEKMMMMKQDDDERKEFGWVLGLGLKSREEFESWEEKEGFWEELQRVPIPRPLEPRPGERVAV
jgi:hypothetical protein